MKVITKYISKEIITFFLLCHFIFILLYLVIDFINKLDRFVDAGVSLSLTLFYFLYKIPTMVVQMTPVATMISIVVVLCIMKKNKEVMAMKTCGLNLLKAFQPVVMISLIISVSSLFLAEVIVPYTSTKSNEIMEIDVKKRPQASFQHWYKSNNNIYWIKYFDIKSKTMKYPTFYFFDDHFRLTKRIKGETASWSNGAWKIENVKILTLGKDNQYSTKKMSSYILKIPETPGTFIKKMKEPEDMSYRELKKHAEKIKAEGYDNTAALVELHMKLAYPFIGSVFALIAIPIGLWQKTSGIPLSITLGILTCFLFWLVMGSARALGLAGVLPPFLSAWMANILFSLSGIYLLMNVKK